MNLSQIEARIHRINDQILDLQDIVFEENIPQEERSSCFYVGVRWHSKEAVEAAKKRIAELEKELAELNDQENLAMAVAGRF